MEVSPKGGQRDVVHFHCKTGENRNMLLAPFG